MKRPLALGVAVLLLILGGIVAPAAAQGRADIVGRVTDASGGVLPGVAVTATNMATNIVSTTATTETGDYVFTGLPIGTYTVKIELDGFKGATTRIVLTTGDRSRVDAKLELGAVSESIQVTGQAALLQSDSSRVASAISEKLVQDAPVPARNIMLLIQATTPGASEGSANATVSGNRPDDRRQSSAASIQGAGEQDNANLIDGMDNNERVQNGMGIKPALDAIQEVNIQTNSYSAENGRTLGGVINIITKSGGNRFSGSGYEFTRNERFDAKNFFAKDIPKDREHQFGGSLGGPIRTSKTFFFFDYSQQRITKGSPTVVTVPTMAMRNGDFSELLPGTAIYDPLTTPRTPFAGNIIPKERFDSVAVKLFKLYPAPNGAGVSNNFAMTNDARQLNHTTDIRIDHRFNSNDSLFARYSYNKTTGLTPSMCPVAEVDGRHIDPTCNTQGTGGIYSGPYLTYAHNMIGSWVHILNTTTLMEVKFNYVRPFTSAKRPSANDEDLGSWLGLQNINYASDPITAGMPWFEPSPLVYAAIGDPTFIPMATEDHTYQVAGSLSKTRGSHNFKVGGGLVYRQFAVQQSQSPRSQFQFNQTLTNNGSTGGNTWASWLLGYPSAIQRIHFPIWPENRTKEPTIYAQDDWRATSWLTVNLGLRYDIYYPTTEAQNQMSAWSVDQKKILVAGKDTTRTGGVNPDYTDIGPRVGFAATLPHSMVLRSGFGMSYNPVLRGANSFLKNPPFTENFGPFTSLGTSGGVPDILLQTPVPPLAFNDPAAPEGQLSTIDPNYKSTRAKQFNAVLEKEFKGNVVSIGYIGARADRINTNQNINAPSFATAGPGQVQPKRPLFALYPKLTTVNMIRNFGARNYNALQLMFNRRYNNGLAVLAHYTWANSRTRALTGWDPYATEWGNTNTYDIPHKVVSTFSYLLPFGKGLTGAAHGALADWQVTTVAYWQAGIAYTVTNASSRTNVGGNDRPNLTGDPDLPSGQRTVQQYFNISAFTLQPQFTAGNTPLGGMHGPPQRRIDFSLSKNLPLRGQQAVQLRLEVFNILNIANFQPPDAAFGGTTFGSISSTGNQIPRQMQFGFKYLF